MIELLAPAGDMTKLKAALYYGADAVYVGGEAFNLRAMARNFGRSELKKAVQLVHAQGKKIYVTLNIFARNYDFPSLIKYAKFLEEINADAVIVSDLGVLKAVRENTNLEVHISTQANVLNKYTAEEYARLGSKRIILARECSLDEIRGIVQHLERISPSLPQGRVEAEVFVHGAMCISYSGRCYLSDYIVSETKSKDQTNCGRSGNRGTCAQACRFKYALVEEKRPGEYYEIEEDQHGTYIMNSRDLCLIEHLDELRKVGVTSFKIEGRTKSEYYVAGVVNAYRRKMSGENFDTCTELLKISHRDYTTGFIFDDKDRQYRQSPSPASTYDFVAIALGGCKVQQRNKFSVGDTLEILSPTDTFNKTFVVTELHNQNREPMTCAKSVQETVFIKCPYKLEKGDILRRKIQVL